jgi:hypothetical protein
MKSTVRILELTKIKTLSTLTDVQFVRVYSVQYACSLWALGSGMQQSVVAGRGKEDILLYCRLFLLVVCFACETRSRVAESLKIEISWV